MQIQPVVAMNNALHNAAPANFQFFRPSVFSFLIVWIVQVTPAPLSTIVLSDCGKWHVNTSADSRSEHQNFNSVNWDCSVAPPQPEHPWLPG